MKLKLEGELFKGEDVGRYIYVGKPSYSSVQKYGSSVIRRMFRVTKIMIIKSKINEKAGNLR